MKAFVWCLLTLALIVPVAHAKPEPPSDLPIAMYDGDKRLLSDVSLQATAKPLGKILADLSRQSGAPLKAADAWVASLPTTVYAAPMPLRRFMSNLARLHNLSWKEGEAVPGQPHTYVLYESAKNRRTIEGILRDGQFQFAQRIRLLRERGAQSAEQLESLAAAGDATAAFLLTTPGAQNAAMLFSALPENAFLSLEPGQSTSFSAASLPSGAQEAVQSLLNNRAHNTTNIQNCRLRCEVQGTGVNANPLLSIEYPGGAFSVPSLGYRGGASRAWLGDVRRRSSTPVGKRASQLHLDGSFAIQTNKWSDYLKAVRKQADINVFADSYPGRSDSDIKPIATSITQAPRQPLQTVLDGSGFWERVWWQEGNEGHDVLFRRDDWYVHRLGREAAILLDCLRKQPKPYSLTINDLLALIELPEEQSAWLEDALSIDMMGLRQQKDKLLICIALEKTKNAEQGCFVSNLPQPAQEQVYQLAMHSGIVLPAGTVLRLHRKERSILELIAVPEQGEPNTLRSWPLPQAMLSGKLPDEEKNDKEEVPKAG